MEKRRLEKKEWRERWSELRDLWNEFDPIGVMSSEDWPKDEYETYVGGCMKLLQEEASAEELEAYVKWAVYEYMGLSVHEKLESDIKSFIPKMQAWFNENWKNTYV